MLAQHFRLMLIITEAFEGCKYSDLKTERTLRLLQQSQFLTSLTAFQASLIIYYFSVCFDRPAAGAKRAVYSPKTLLLFNNYSSSALWI